MTGTALDLTGPADTLDAALPAFELAERIAKTEFVPKDLRDRPTAVMAAILTGRELGIAPMQALRSIHVIEGRPTLAAEMIRALVLRAGHQIWPADTNAKSCTMVGIRAGTDREVRITWTIADAERANLARKHVWRSYPRQMLLARATVELARILFADVIAGLYAAEEFDELPLAPGDEPSADEPAPTTKRRRKTKTAQSTAAATAPASPTPQRPAQAAPPPLPGEPGYADKTVRSTEGPDGGGEDRSGPSGENPGGSPGGSDPLTDDVVEAELVEDEPPPPKRDITDVQRLVIHCQKNGLDDTTRHDLASRVTKGRATSFNDLSDDELAIIRSIVDDIADGAATIGYDAAGALTLIEVPAGDTDWKALAATAGWTAAQTLLEARTIATELGQKPPGSLDEITDPDIAAALRSKLQDPPF
jgi:hypothetical protein